jgi:tetratricopeptide (TPR) repeat protein
MRTIVVSPGELPEAARKPNPNRHLQIAGVAAGALAAAAVAVYFALSEGPGDAEATAPTLSSTQAPDAVLADSASGVGENTRVTSSNPGPSDTDESRIAELLLQAEEAIGQNRLSSPPGDNALEKYHQVFELDPGNRAAREGQVRVADRYLALAKSAVRERRIRSAKRYVDKVQDFAPGHSELAATQQLVTNAEKYGASAQKNELRIMGLLGQARIALSDDKLTTPKGASAYDKYKAVLKLDPNHQQALEGVQRVASRYLQLAEGEVRNGNFTKADDYLAKAALVSPTHPGLAAARASARQSAERAHAGG